MYRVMVVLLIVACGCIPHSRNMGEPYPVRPRARWLIHNIDKPNGPSLTGYRHTTVYGTAEIDLMGDPILVDGSIRPTFDAPPPEVEGIEVRVEEVRTVKVGVVQLRDPQDWEEFRRWQGSSRSFLGVAVVWQF